MIKLYKYSSSNTPATAVEIRGYVFYFSYETLVAFKAPDARVICSQNIWSNTTGKHLALIQPDESLRIPYAEFDKLACELNIYVDYVKETTNV